MRASRLLLSAFAAIVLPAAEPPELAVNGGVEDGAAGWGQLWTRDDGVGTATIDRSAPHTGQAAWRIEHRGSRDWSLAQDRRIAVRPGEILALSAWIRVAGAGGASLGMIARDAAGTVLDWNLGGRDIAAGEGWRQVVVRLAIPDGVATVQARLIGDGQAVVGLDDLSLVSHGLLDGLRNPDLPAVLSVDGPHLRLAFDTRTAGITITDRDSGRTWPAAGAPPGVVVRAARQSGADGLELRLLDAASQSEFDASLRLDPARPELTVELRGAGAMSSPLRWPPAFASAAGQSLVLPLNEGIAYPTDDATLPAMRYYLYGGHGLCMPWYGATGADGAGWMALVGTPDDAEVDLPRRDGLLQLVPLWQPQRQAFGGPRQLRFVFLGHGGHVAMAKRYREQAAATGLLRTLADKRVAVPAVDLLVGAVNTWCWDGDAVGICGEMQAAGIKRILWSNALPAAQLTELNRMAVLTSRYDIYQDTMDPAQFSRLRYTHPDWTTAAWAQGDLQRDADGRLTRGWEIEAKDGPMVPCGVLCDRQALPYVRERIAAELKTRPYRCRFIDTTTASPWRECWDERHPMTRSDSRTFRVDLLRVVSGEFALVCGSETGHDAAVPVVHYFEGMLSLGPYRVPDAGRDMLRRWDEVPPAVAAFQTGHRYRLPLWELVYHDCVVAHWYWGDYNNKLPALWDRRDLWNALYGTMPMFMFERAYWTQQRERFVRSYSTTAPIARATGYSEMLDHAWLTADHAVQRTRFAGGISVTVNFGDAPWSDAAGTIAPLGLRVEGLP
jgi:hypothetical protein